jgi:hypothetical protein
MAFIMLSSDNACSLKFLQLLCNQMLYTLAPSTSLHITALNPFPFNFSNPQSVSQAPHIHFLITSFQSFSKSTFKIEVIFTLSTVSTEHTFRVYISLSAPILGRKSIFDRQTKYKSMLSD